MALVVAAAATMAVLESAPRATLLVVLVVAIGLVGLWIWVSAPRKRRARLARLAQLQTLGNLRVLTPAEFEETVASLLRQLGYRDVKRTGRSGDLGADIVARDPNGRSLVVQCKRYAPGSQVGSPDIQRSAC